MSSTAPIPFTNNLQTILQSESSSTSKSSAGSASSTSSTSSTSGTSAAQTQLNSFLNLLTTEMQNQDPTQPMSDSDMMQQLGELTNIQAQLNSDTLMQTLVSQVGSQQLNSVVNYIGKSVQATGNSIALNNGQAELDYTLPSAAASATVTITDASGNTVFSGTGTTTSGQNQIFWNGSTTSGTQAPDGTYTYSVTATDASGKALTASTFTTGVVTSVDMNNGSPTLNLGTLAVPLSNVTQISSDPFTAASTSSTTQSGT